jgi:polyisoprenoid-binding protein YceI
MKKTILVLALFTATSTLFAQKKTTSSAIVTFDATTEKDALPKAENKTTIAALDTKTGTVAFESAVKNFAFSNPMMHDHFNSDKWFNSDKFPTFTFKGKIADLSKVNFKKDGSYTVSVSGDLTVKDITKPVITPATIVVSGAKISTTTAFTILLADYSVTGPPIDGGKVAKEPKITVSAEF